jgi:hypothetical protein
MLTSWLTLLILFFKVSERLLLIIVKLYPYSVRVMPTSKPTLFASLRNVYIIQFLRNATFPFTLSSSAQEQAGFAFILEWVATK